MISSNTVDPSHNFLEWPPHPLRPFFHPKSVAVIGATNREKAVGSTLMNNLVEGKFDGKIYPINPKRKELFNLPCFPSITEVPGDVELAVIITPAKTVPDLIDQCAKKKVKGVIIISAGFKELGEEGQKLENEVLERAAKGNIRIVGPNCLGIMNPLANFNATFAASMALKGNVAFISQSGAMCTAVLDWSYEQNIGFSAFVSIGSMADVNWGDLIDYLGRDPNTKSILIYMESIGNAKDFLSAAREVALSKPIIVIKAGRTEAAAKAAASHTGSLAGSDEAFDAAMQRVGVLRVDTIAELFDMAEILAKQPTPQGPRLAILTNAGGPAVLATDAAARYGAEIAPISKKTIKALSDFLPAAWSHANPVDLLGDASPDHYAKAIEIVSKDENVDGILTILTPQDMTDVTGTAEKIAPYANLPQKPMLASWMGGKTVREGSQLLADAKIPVFEYPDSASKAFASMWKQNHALMALYETPELLQEPTLAQKRYETAQKIIDKALKENREILTENESKMVLDAYEIPIVQTIIAETPEKAMEAAEKIGYPAVVKLNSETITHKMDVGGVILNLKDKESVGKAFNDIKTSVTYKKGAEHFQGVTVQKMLNLSEGYELILGSTVDVQFGPIILFGTGGTLVEVYRDRALGLPPLNATLAKRLMSRTKIYEALKGIRGKESIDFSELGKILIGFAEMVISHPHIKECDINPLLASSEHFTALDARIVLHAKGEELSKPVIRPYPSAYVSTAKLKNGQEITLRPIRPEDEPLLIPFHEELSEKSVQARYFEEMTLEQRTAHNRLTRVCHTDYDKEMTLVAQLDGKIVGVGRLTRIQKSDSAEYRMIIIDRVQKQGLGTTLLKRILEIAKEEGLKQVQAQVLNDNKSMQKVLTSVGFKLKPSQKNPHIINATLTLTS